MTTQRRIDSVQQRFFYYCVFAATDDSLMGTPDIVDSVKTLQSVGNHTSTSGYKSHLATGAASLCKCRRVLVERENAKMVTIQITRVNKPLTKNGADSQLLGTGKCPSLCKMSASMRFNFLLNANTNARILCLNSPVQKAWQLMV